MQKFFSLCVCFLGLVAVAQAEILAGYDFDSDSSDQSAVTEVGEHVTASSLSSPMDIAYMVAGDTSGLDTDGETFGNTEVFGSVAIQVEDAITSSFDDAVSGADYITFTVTPDDGFVLNLSSISFKAAKKAETSVDEYAVTDADGNLIGSTFSITNVVGLSGTYDGVSVNLSADIFQNLSAATEFRIYAWGRGTTDTINTLAAIDKVVLKGTTESTLLIGYDFGAGAPSEASVAPSNVTAGPVTSPMDIVYVSTAGDNSGTDAYNADLGSTDSLGCVVIGVDEAPTASFDEAVAGDDYLSFTVTPDAGVGVQLYAITLKAAKQDADSVDEYAITDADGNLIGSAVSITNVLGLTGAYDGVSVDLSGTDYEYLNEATEFRIYAWGAGTASTADTLATLDKISLHGTTITLSGDCYVSSTGDDANEGTADEPFASIQYAVDQATPGSTIYIRGGTYHEEIDLSGVAGFPNAPITLTPYDNETVMLDGTTAIAGSWILDEGSENVYKTTLSEDITQLFVDGEIMTLARFPNALVWSDEMWTARTKKQDDSTRGNIVGTSALSTAGVSFEGCIGLFNFGNYETILAKVTSHTAGTNVFSYAPTAGTWRTSDDYFFEGGVDNAERVMLDIAQEWAYDESTKTLYLWADDGLNPDGREIAGKVQTYALTGDATTQNIIIDGLDFFATTFKFSCSDNITLKNCDSDYPTASDRALGSIETPVTGGLVGTASDWCEDITIYNCTFNRSDTSAMVCRYLEDSVVENNLFADINYGCINSAGVIISQTRNLVLRRNTLIRSGPTAGFRLGRYTEDEDILPLVVEYNIATKCSQLQEDGAAIYMASAGIVGSVSRFNWMYDNYQRDFRWDGLNDPLTGIEANLYRNVSRSSADKAVNLIGAAYKLKGDFHEIYNNIAVQVRGDFEVSIEKGGNDNSYTYNNAGDYLSGNDYGAAVPGNAANNYAGQDEPREMSDLLRNYTDLDFRPKADAIELVDQALSVSCDVLGETYDVTAGYNGTAPDIGAYEYGDENYWIPGYQYTQASMPIPSDGITAAKYDSDLMWLGGLDAVSYDIYLGTASDSLVLVGSQTNNIFTLDEWINDQTYYWRIDSVLADSSVVTGEVWTFTIADHKPRAYSSREAVEEEGAVAFELTGYDPDGTDVDYTLTESPSHGTLSGSAPNYTYSPNEDFYGSDYILFTVTDGTNTSSEGIVIFGVAGVDDDAPCFTYDTMIETTASRGAVYSSSIADAASDPDGQSLTYSIVSGPSWLTISSDGTLSGTPSVDDIGINSWVIEVTDPTGLSATATLEIRVVEGDLTSLNFVNLTTSTTANSLMVGGSTSNLTVTGKMDGDDYLYSVVYENADYDGDSTNDTLTFDVRVRGWSGSITDAGTDGPDASCNSASATIGTTASFVSIDASTFIVGDSLMNNGETLEFLVENLAVSLSDTGACGTGFASGFTSARLEQTATTANSHQAVFGSGTGLLGWDFNINQESGTLNVGRDSLYISSDLGDGTRSTSWGVANVDFGIEVAVASTLVAGDVEISRDDGEGCKLHVSELLAECSNPDGLSLGVSSVDSESAGAQPITFSGSWIIYSPADDYELGDSFGYSLTNSLGVSSSAQVIITLTGSTESECTTLSIVPDSDGTASLTMHGIPGRTVTVETTTNLVDGVWTTSQTCTFDACGCIEFVDTTTCDQQYYRMRVSK
jgi:hypothetical protein